MLNIITVRETAPGSQLDTMSDPRECLPSNRWNNNVGEETEIPLCCWWECERCSHCGKHGSPSKYENSQDPLIPLWGHSKSSLMLSQLLGLYVKQHVSRLTDRNKSDVLQNLVTATIEPQWTDRHYSRTCCTPCRIEYVPEKLVHECG